MSITSFTIILVVIYLIFLNWNYRWLKKPLTKAEIDRLSAKGGYDDMSAVGKANFRRFMEADDGKPFYMVNLMKYREKALYHEGEFPDVKTGEDAAKLYNRAVIKELIKRGSYPVFYSRKMANLISDSDGTDFFEHVGIVRYRSRRDLLNMVESPVYEECIKHKWASLEKTVAVPTRRVMMIDPAVTVTLAMVIIWLAVILAAS
ncbi:MAG TPA: hypothetical protein VIS94_10600 [Desulfomonilia bacterium]